MGTKPFTEKAVIDDCLDMLALSTRNIKCDETALIDTGHHRVLELFHALKTSGHARFELFFAVR